MLIEVLFNSLAIPDPPQNITVDTKGSRVVNISWTAGYDGNRAIENFIVEISDHDQIRSQAVHVWFPVSLQLPLLQVFFLGQHIISECSLETKLAEVAAALF